MVVFFRSTIMELHAFKSDDDTIIKPIRIGWVISEIRTSVFRASCTCDNFRYYTSIRSIIIHSKIFAFNKSMANHSALLPTVGNQKQLHVNHWPLSDLEHSRQFKFTLLLWKCWQGKPTAVWSCYGCSCADENKFRYKKKHGNDGRVSSARRRF